MNYILSVELTDKSPVKLHLTTEDNYPIKISVEEIDFTIKKSTNYTLPEYTISFVPQKKISMYAVRVLLPYNENKTGDTSPIYFYDNNICTNAFADIKEIAAETPYTYRSREIVLAQNNSGRLNIAFTTFNRFYTEFGTNKKDIAASIYLENKPVKKGELYTLETIAMDDSTPGLEFFEEYTEILSKKHTVVLPESIPVGWSSWSCLYGSVTQNEVLKQAGELATHWKEKGADLIQIDDGWQEGGSFASIWTNNKNTFPDDIPQLKEELNKLGLRLGLWLSPGLIIDKSEAFENFRPYINTVDGKMVKHFGGDDTLAADINGSVYGLRLDDKYVLDYIKEVFHKCKDEYGACYFKLDFLINLLIRLGNGASRVEYTTGYAVEVYRNFIHEIRKTVGEDSFLLACGSPVGESIGIYDSIRISNDITWEGAGNPGSISPWLIMWKDAQSAFLRSPFHKKVFINDPDALLVRDFDSGHNDGLNLTYEEAKMWATVVAMTGGQILINEEIHKLSEERKALIDNILPPLGLAARPRNFFEFPKCTETFINFDENSQLCALYNWDEEEITKEFKNPFEKKAIMIDCWSHEIIGEIETTYTFTFPPHTCKAMLVKRIPSPGEFLYNDGNFYLGLGERNGKDYYYKA